MLTVRDRLPDVVLTGVTDAGFAPVDTRDFGGRWTVLFSWPKDFTFVCPTEIATFGARIAEFTALEADVYGLSLDSEFVHQAWRSQHPDLRNLPFPMLADVKRELSEALGILDAEEGVPLRATFIIDPDRIIRHVSVHDLDTGRDVGEVLRTLGALQAGGLTACGWTPGTPVLTPA